MTNSGVPEGPGSQVQPEARRAQQRQQQGEEGGQVEPEEPRSAAGMMAYSKIYFEFNYFNYPSFMGRVSLTSAAKPSILVLKANSNIH